MFTHEFFFSKVSDSDLFTLILSNTYIHIYISLSLNKDLLPVEGLVVWFKIHCSFHTNTNHGSARLCSHFLPLVLRAGILICLFIWNEMYALVQVMKIWPYYSGILTLEEKQNTNACKRKRFLPDAVPRENWVRRLTQSLSVWSSASFS